MHNLQAEIKQAFNTRGPLVLRKSHHLAPQTGVKSAMFPLKHNAALPDQEGLIDLVALRTCFFSNSPEALPCERTSLVNLF
eukprot:9908875-Prorocentrum_lima.AAC.1